MLILDCIKAKIHPNASLLDEKPRVCLIEAPSTEPRVAQRAVPPAIAVPLALCSRDQSQRKGCAPASPEAQPFLCLWYICYRGPEPQLLPGIAIPHSCDVW